MAQVSVNRDLKEYRKKIVMGLTARQLFCFGVAGATGFFIYRILRLAFSPTMSASLMVFLIMPIFLVCLFEKDGRYAEQYAKDIIIWRFVRPGIRENRTENIYEELAREAAFRKAVKDAQKKSRKRP